MPRKPRRSSPSDEPDAARPPEPEQIELFPEPVDHAAIERRELMIESTREKMWAALEIVRARRALRELLH